jgi:hypothetical protein
LLLLHSSAPVEAGVTPLVAPAWPPVALRLARDDLPGALTPLPLLAPVSSALRSEKLSEVLMSDKLDRLSKLIEPLIIWKKKQFTTLKK